MSQLSKHYVLTSGEVTLHAWATPEVTPSNAPHQPDDAAPVLLFVHGLAGFGLEFQPLLDELPESWQAITFDQRGHGQSTQLPEDVSRETFVSDALAVLDFFGVERAILVGQSMGVSTAFLTAAAHPERVSGLVLIEGSPSGEPTSATENVIDWFRSWPIPFADFETAQEFFGGGKPGEIWAQTLKNTPEGLVPPFDVDVMHRALSATHAQDRWEEWEAVKCPSLIVKGENGFLPQAELEKMLATNQLAHGVVVEKSTHDAHLENPVALAREMERFLIDSVR